jgi:hypothetical protein
MLADALFRKNPFRIKYVTHTWGRHDTPYRNFWRDTPPTSPNNPYFILEDIPHYLSLAEEQEIFATHIARLGLFQFLCRPALAEGDVSQQVFGLSLRDDDRDSVTGEYVFPDETMVSQVRSVLAAQFGMPPARLQKELKATLPKAPPDQTPPPAPAPVPAALNAPQVQRRYRRA